MFNFNYSLDNESIRFVFIAAVVVVDAIAADAATAIVDSVSHISICSLLSFAMFASLTSYFTIILNFLCAVDRGTSNEIFWLTNKQQMIC